MTADNLKAWTSSAVIDRRYSLPLRADNQRNAVGFRGWIDIAHGSQSRCTEGLKECIGIRWRRICPNEDKQTCDLLREKGLTDAVNLPTARDDCLAQLRRVLQRLRVSQDRTDREAPRRSGRKRLRNGRCLAFGERAWTPSVNCAPQVRHEFR